MNYGDIVRKAWALAWQHKSLWIMGLFASGGSGAGFGWREHFGGKVQLSPPILVALLVAGLVLLFVFIVLSLICNAGLVDAVNKLARGGVYRLRDSFSVGLDFFWRFLGVALLGIFSAVVMIAVLAIPAVLCFFVSTLLGVLSLLVLIPLLLIGCFVINGIFQLAARALVVRNASIGDALEEGYYLFRKRLVPNLAIFVIYLLIAIGVAIVSLIIFGIVAGPFIAMALLSTSGLVIALGIGLPLVLVVSWVINGMTGSFFSALYTLFYFELVEPTAMPAAPAQAAGSPV